MSKFLADSEIERLKRVWLSWENSGEIRLEKGHRIWRKTVSKEYGRVGVTISMKTGSTVKKRILAHVLSYFLKDNSFDCFNRTRTLDISHLCFHKLCVSPDHLSLESRQENIRRKQCHKKKYCFGHGENPKCIFQ